MNPTPSLALDNITLLTPGGGTLCQGISALVFPEQALLISGANGSGKTTLLRALLQMHPLNQGQVHWLAPKNLRGYLPQLQMTHTHLPFLLSDLIEDQAAALKLGLLEERHLRIAWNSASGGERKRALLTRILLTKPEAIILDEPLNHLDSESRLMIVRQVRRYLEEPNAARIAVIVSHDSSWEEGLGKNMIVKVAL
jgi:ABC-type cobalamin/Fe3+-siderophores transport system ATPase subunit